MSELLLSVAGEGVVRDLAVDADAPVIDLLPVLAGALGLDPGDPWHLVDGARTLAPDRSLAVQGVLHGGVLHLAPRA